MKVFLLECRMDPNEEWYTVRTFTDDEQELAERTFYHYVDKFGHDTYIQLVEIKRRVVKSC
jgi:hypothetical protein